MSVCPQVCPSTIISEERYFCVKCIPILCADLCRHITMKKNGVLGGKRVTMQHDVMFGLGCQGQMKRYDLRLRKSV